MQNPWGSVRCHECFGGEGCSGCPLRARAALRAARGRHGARGAREPALASCIPWTKKEIILSARRCSPSGPVPPQGFAVEPMEPPLPRAGGRWGLRNRRYFTTGPSVATVHLPSGPSTVKQRRCSCRAQTAAPASPSHPASPEEPHICGDGAGAMEPLRSPPHRHVCPAIAGSTPK